MDLGGAPASRVADGLDERPFCAPAAERWALMWVLSIDTVAVIPVEPVRASNMANQMPCRLQRLKRLWSGRADSSAPSADMVRAGSSLFVRCSKVRTSVWAYGGHLARAAWRVGITALGAARRLGVLRNLRVLHAADHQRTIRPPGQLGPAVLR